MNNKLATSTGNTKTITPFVLLIVAIGIIEFLVIQLLPWFESTFPAMPEAALDIILLSVSIAPLVFLFIRKDLHRYTSTDKGIRNQLLLASGLPLVIALGLMFNILSSKKHQIAEMEKAEHVVLLDKALSDYVDIYSDEIEYSALSLIDEQYSSVELNRIRAESDHLLEQLRKLIVEKGVNVGDFDTQFFEVFSANIDRLREGTDNKSLPWNFYTSFFMNSNEQFLRKLTTFSKDLGNEDVEKRHVNYLSLIKLRTIHNVIRVTMAIAIAKESSERESIDLKTLKRDIRFKHAQNTTYSDMFLSSTLNEEREYVSAEMAHEFHNSIASFHQLLEERRVEALIAELRGFIGYNGLIHQFKNYVLRGDDKYEDRFKEQYIDVNETLEQLLNLIQYNDEAVANVLKLRGVFQLYSQALDKAKIYHGKGYASHEIDRLVVVDDSPAQQALNYLQRSLWESNPLIALDAYKQRREVLNKLDGYLRQKLADSHAELLQQKIQESYFTAAIALLLGVLVLSLLVVISKRISISYQQRIEALKKAEEAAKLKSEFLANMSHEIRTPMNGVLGMLSLLSNSELTEEQAHRVNVAISSGDSLLTLINDILDFSKVEAGKLDLELIDFDVRRLFGDIAEAMALQAQEKSIEIVLDLRSVEHSMIKTDPGRLRQIVTNIVGNAIKFTAKGEIIITVQLEPSSNKGQMILKSRIQDSGIGIPKDKISKLFGAFNQVDASTTRKYGGTGLGLTITRKLCQLLGGDISVSSELHKGSCFDFSIIVESSQQSALVLPEFDISTLEILIVDDNKTNREVLKGQLEAWGAKVSEAASGKQALELCQLSIEASADSLFDIALIDMQMPTMNGEELGEKIRANSMYENMKLIMMTSMGERGDVQRYANIGFDGYFPKPTTTKDLFYALSIVAEGGEAFKQATPLVTSHHIHSAQQESAGVVTPDAWTKETRILLVEDNRVNQMVALGVLKDLGITADIAGNGIEAIDSLTNSLSIKPYSLVLMDCQMPEMDGYQATQLIRQGKAGEANKAIPIVAMTANAMRGDREKCLSAGMDDYLTKPIASDKIRRALNVWLERTHNEDENQPSIEDTTTNELGDKLETGNVWDESTLLNRVNGNVARAMMLTEFYLNEVPKKMEHLNQLITEQDFKKISDCIYSISEIAGNIGGKYLFTMTKDLQHLYLNNHYDEVLKRLPTLAKAESQLRATLAKWHEEKQENE